MYLYGSVTSRYHTKSKIIDCTYEGLQDAAVEGVGGSSDAGLGGGGIATADSCRSETSEPAADVCGGGAYCGL